MPGSVAVSSPRISAASRGTPRTIGTRSNGEPRKASIRPRRRLTVVSVSLATRASTRVRSPSGRSAGRTLTVHDGVFTATGRPDRSKISPRGAGIGTSTVRSAATRRAYSSPFTTCSWNSRPPSARSRRAAMTLKAKNLAGDRRRSARPSFRSAMRLPRRGLVGDIAGRDRASRDQRDGRDDRVQSCGAHEKCAGNGANRRVAHQLAEAEADRVRHD